MRIALETNVVSRRLDEQSINSAVTLLSALENSKRLTILRILVEGEMPVGQLAEKVGLSQSALSQHLSKLRNANVVQTRRDAQTIYYFSRSEPVRQILAALEEIFSEEAPRLSVPA
nr:metalloregulator ArsR/SmtB family transcription factor [Agrobacterium sp. DSM 25558]